MQIGPNVNTQHGGKIPGSSSTPAKPKKLALDHPVETMPFSKGFAGNKSSGSTGHTIASTLQASAMKSNESR